MKGTDTQHGLKAFDCNQPRQDLRDCTHWERGSRWDEVLPHCSYFFFFILNIFQFAMGGNRAQEKKRQPCWADEAHIGPQSFQHCRSLNSKIPGRSLLFFFSKNSLDLEVCFLELPSRENLMRSSFGLELSGAALSGPASAFEPKFCSSMHSPGSDSARWTPKASHHSLPGWQSFYHISVVGSLWLSKNCAAYYSTTNPPLS